MKGQLFNYWNRVRSSFWFIPGVMSVTAVVLAIVSVVLDKEVAGWFERNDGWTFTGGAEGASAVLGVIAGSMIAITGVVFSMTLVALSLASTQLGPRLLRTFMRDTRTQVVLGTFIAAFLYCLLVLGTIRHADEVAFVPHLSVMFGVLLAVASVGVLIYFIHHVSVSIQANEIVARINRELTQKIDRLYPGQFGAGAPTNAPAHSMRPSAAQRSDTADKDARPVGAVKGGYVQFIDGAALLELATMEDVVIRLERRPGNYVSAGCFLAHISPGIQLTDRMSARIRDNFVLGHQRTADQDFEFGVNQLVEVAVRALSPGLNDPFTAVTCVDRLGSILCRLATCELPSHRRYDKHGRLRLIAPAHTFSELTDSAFNQIRQYGRTSVAVTIRLIDTIAVVARLAPRPEDRAVLLRHAEMIARGAAEALPEVEDRRAVEERFEVVVELCREPVGSSG